MMICSKCRVLCLLLAFGIAGPGEVVGDTLTAAEGPSVVEPPASSESAAASAGTEAPAEHVRFAPVARLAGRCFAAQLGSDTRDVHCYEWTIQDRFLRDRHRLTGPRGVYEGETLYGWDSRTQTLRYWYFNSLGGVSEGTVEQRDGEWWFLETYRGAKEPMKLRSVLRWGDGEGYSVVTEALREGEWQHFSSMSFEPAESPDVGD